MRETGREVGREEDVRGSSLEGPSKVVVLELPEAGRCPARKVGVPELEDWGDGGRGRGSGFCQGHPAVWGPHSFTRLSLNPPLPVFLVTSTSNLEMNRRDIEFLSVGHLIDIECWVPLRKARESSCWDDMHVQMGKLRLRTGLRQDLLSLGGRPESSSQHQFLPALWACCAPPWTLT